MIKDKLITNEDIENTEVRLKPFWGMSPGRWLAALGVFALVIVLFLLLILPGLINPGTLYSFVSVPSGAAVFVDGGYAGTTPCDAFLQKGEHEIVVGRPGFSDSDVSRTVPGRLFASLLIPRRESVKSRLNLLDGEKIWKTAVVEFSAWNLAGDPTSVWQAPAVLESAAAARFADASAPPPSPEERRDFILAAARVITNSSAAKELIRAAAIVFGSGDPDSPDTDAEWRKIFSESPPLAALLSEFAPDAAKDLPGIRGSGASKPAAHSPSASRDAPVTVRSVRFLPVSAAVSSSFYLAETETTVGQYAAFLRENPRWAAGNRDSLVAEGMVTEDYLAGYDKASPGEPVRGVSWYAAKAYADWLGLSAPSGHRITLPGETEWELAASAGGGTGSQIWSDGVRYACAPAENRRRDEAGFADLLGNLWEWCEDSYAAFPEIGSEAAQRFPGSERSVRGGCWANARGTVTETTRGSFPPQWCSDFLGFRLALTETPR